MTLLLKNILLNILAINVKMFIIHKFISNIKKEILLLYLKNFQSKDFHKHFSDVYDLIIFKITTFSINKAKQSSFKCLNTLMVITFSNKIFEPINCVMLLLMIKILNFSLVILNS